MTDIQKKPINTALGHLKPNMRLLTLQDLEKLKIRDPNIRETLEAQIDPRIHNELPKDIKEKVNRIVFLAMERIGQKNIEPERALIIEQDLISYLQSRYFNWSLKEVDMACRMGALGELGEMPPKHLTSQNLIQWLKAYDTKVRSKTSRALNQAVSEYNREREAQLLKEAPKMSQEQKESFVEDAFDKWLQDESVPGSVIFKVLEDLGWVNYSTDQKWELLKSAMDNLRLKYQAIKDNEGLRQTARQKIWELDQVVIGKAQTIPDFLKVESQRLGMELFFKDCHKSEMRPRDLSKDDPGDLVDPKKGSPINQVSLNQHGKS